MKAWMGCGLFGVIAAVLAILLLVWGIAGYNRFVRLENAVDGA